MAFRHWVLHLLGVPHIQPEGIIGDASKDEAETRQLIEDSRKSVVEAATTRALRSDLNNQLADTLRQARESLPLLP